MTATSIASVKLDESLNSARTLASFKGTHQGETILVCGCGESLKELEDPGGVVTIGVNDVGRQFDPTYLVVLNSPGQFAKDRFSFVHNSRASFVFSQRDDLDLATQSLVKIKLGQSGGSDP